MLRTKLLQPVLMLAVIAVCSLVSKAAIRHDTLYINRGQFLTIKNTSFPALAFNRTNTYSATSALLTVRLGDTLIIRVTNNDVAPHGFIGAKVSHAPGESWEYQFIADSQGVFLYYDPLDEPTNRYLGLAGMIAVLPDDSKSFFWNIREYEASYSTDLAGGRAVDWMKYDPDYFTINGQSYPAIEQDTLAKVRAHIGEKIHLFIANTGQSMHSLHLHGFHSKVLASTNSNIRKGWNKDSFPIKKMSGVLLELIPDKPGKYSVHDHNLVAVSAGGTHPNGMFTIMEVQ